MLIIDTASYERSLFSMGGRGAMEDPRTGQSRVSGSTLSLGNLLSSLKVDVQCAMHNSGNDAFMCLFALQKLLDPANTPVPKTRERKPSITPATMYTPSGGMQSPMSLGYLAVSPAPLPSNRSRTWSGVAGGVSPRNEFGQIRQFGARSPKADQTMQTGDDKQASTVKLSTSMKSLALK